jgi:hypothetical protein
MCLDPRLLFHFISWYPWWLLGAVLRIFRRFLPSSSLLMCVPSALAGWPAQAPVIESTWHIAPCTHAHTAAPGFAVSSRLTRLRLRLRIAASSTVVPPTPPQSVAAFMSNYNNNTNNTRAHRQLFSVSVKETRCYHIYTMYYRPPPNSQPPTCTSLGLGDPAPSTVSHLTPHHSPYHITA